MTRIAVLGAGKIGRRCWPGCSGRRGGGRAGVHRAPPGARRRAGASGSGVASASVAEAAGRSEIVVVAVKPQDITPVLDELAPDLRPGTLVVSLCAGLPTSLFERALPDGTAVVRVMPNTPMLVGEAMSAVSAGTHATEEQLAAVEKMLASVGRVVRVPESQQDAVTALSGSGPAYFFYLVEAMIDAGILLGAQPDRGPPTSSCSRPSARPR